MARLGPARFVVGWLAIGCVLAAIGAGDAMGAPAGQITEFSVPTANSQPVGIAGGPDGNLWFTESGRNQIGRITLAGQITEFSVPTANSQPDGIAAGPDGNLWFTENHGDQIGRITPAGQITEFPVPTASSYPFGIAGGPDGNLWFTESGRNQIGRITPAGQITEFPVPTASSYPFGIAAGPDGNLWFTESGGNQIGRITPAGQITEFPVPTASSYPFGIAAGPDGNLWFTESGGDQIGRITPAGQITEFPAPPSGSAPVGIAAGPDGNLWFTETVGDQIEPITPAEIGRITTAEIGRITPAGQITEFSLPTADSAPFGIAAGPDGNLWFTELGGDKIGQVGAGAPAALVRAPRVTGSARQGTQQVCQGELWADWARQQPVQNAPTATPPGVRWLLNGTVIAGATGETYTPVAGDVGGQLSCTVTATYRLLGVIVSATSAGVEVLAPAPPPPPKPRKPTTSDASLSGIAGASPTVGFTLTAGSNANPVKSIVVDLPSGISFSRNAESVAKGIALSGPGVKRLKFKTYVSHGMLTITLASTVTKVQVTIASPAIAVSKSLASKVKHRQVKTLSFIVKVTDSAKTTTTLRLTLTNLKV